jgi:DNA repair protein RadC
MSTNIKKVGEPSSYHLKITDWPKDERPREKLMHRGPEVLSEAELLALLIGTGTKRITAVDLAKTVLKEYGSLGHLATRGYRDLLRFRGLGEAKSVLLIAAFEVGRRSGSSKAPGRMQVRSPEDIVRYFQPLMRDMQKEVFKVILLDSANHLLRDVTVSEGILNSSLVHPREVFRPAILEPAASVILLHNHPSGNPEPSSEDIQITRQICESGRFLGIPVHDHIIITAGGFTSFAERGLL